LETKWGIIKHDVSKVIREGLELYFHTLLHGVKKHPMMCHEVKFVATPLDLGIIIQNIHKAQELQKTNWQTI
jgi:hypothetical protein